MRIVGRSAGVSLLTVVVLAIGGCASPEQPTASPQPLRPVSLPPLQGMSESVAEQLSERYAVMERARAAVPQNSSDLARAFGELGKVLLGARYVDAAEPALRNASALDPADARWPYYLAHLARQRGDLAEATQQFERVLALQAADLPTLVWLADGHLTQGRDDAAEPYVERALRIDASSVAALYHAGRLSLARKDYRGAVDRLEAALARDSTATAIHYPLAMAYRGVGDTARAERHMALRARDNRIVSPVDPLMQELEQSVAGPLAFEVRGVEALSRGDWRAAADAFRAGAELAPKSAPLHHRLGTALVMLGNPDEARREFERALEVSPGYAKAHYSLGLLFEDRGNLDRARVEYEAALKTAPDYAEARLRLADALRRSGRLADALAGYDQVSEADPSLSEASLGRALALAGMGRHVEARDQLAAGIQAFPDQLGFRHALGRLLAASPDSEVRDGRRALALIETVLKTDQSTEVGEALAMALAELGRFGEAASVQRDLIAAAQRSGNGVLARALGENLKLYEAKRPSRTVWRTYEVGQEQ